MSAKPTSFATKAQVSLGSTSPNVITKNMHSHCAAFQVYSDLLLPTFTGLTPPQEFDHHMECHVNHFHFECKHFMHTASSPWFQCLTKEQQEPIVLVDFSAGVGNNVLKLWQAC
eukprot:scaffold24345_cov64-Attheya_sp.AAC.8